MTYALVAMAESLVPWRGTSPKGREAVAWLLANDDLDADGRPGWGLPQAYDAFGDGVGAAGTENPAHHPYTITTAMCLDAITAGLRAGWLDDHQQRRAQKICSSVALRWTAEVMTPSDPGAYFWYSTHESDAKFCPNASSMMAGALQAALTVGLVEPDNRVRAGVDAAVVGLRAATVEDAAMYPAWRYLAFDVASRHNDAVHHAYTVWGLEQYRAHGGSMALPWTAADSAASMLAFLHDDRLVERPATGRATPPPMRLWGAGMLLAMLARYGPIASAFRVAHIILEAYDGADGPTLVPAASPGVMYPRHASHLLLGLAELARRERSGSALGTQATAGRRGPPASAGEAEVIRHVADAGRAEGFESNAAAVGLPPLNERRSDVYASYRLRFLDDGYPGRLSDRGLHPHPIYGTYVVTDYLAQYERTKDERYLTGARMVADAAIARMSDHHGGLAFWYEPDHGISSLPLRFYSALTQTRYLHTLSELHRNTGVDRYRDAARAIFKSLLVPVDQGGVLRVHDPGVVIEEHAHEYPDYTLNGWTTAMLLIHGYGRAMDEPEAMGLFDQSVAALRDVIHLYDVPELANSRYRLTGPAAVRIHCDPPGAVIEAARIVMPGYGEYPIALEKAGRWQNHVRSGIDRNHTVASGQVAAQVFLSMVTAPAPNSICLSLTTTRSTAIRMSIGQGAYQPTASYLPVQSHAEFASVRLDPGQHQVEFEIPWVLATLVAYPTSFAKVIAGRNYNVYHRIHVSNLDKLFEITRAQEFLHWADVWRGYPEKWPLIPEYAEADIALDRYGS